MLWYCINWIITLVSSQKFFKLITRIIFEASSVSGLSQNLLARTKQAENNKINVLFFRQIEARKKIFLPAAWSARTRCRSNAFSMDPLKFEKKTVWNIFEEDGKILFNFILTKKKIKIKNTFLPEVLYSSCLSLEQAFKFQIRFFFIEKNYFHIDIISGWMEKICQKCLDRFVIYVSTNQYKLPAIRSIFASIPLIGKVIT